MHGHKKYTFIITNDVNDGIIMLPDGEYFTPTSQTPPSNKVTHGNILVYVNGLLQPYGISFNEIIENDGDIIKGIGVDFEDTFVLGDIVTIEWINRFS